MAETVVDFCSRLCYRQARSSNSSAIRCLSSCYSLREVFLVELYEPILTNGYKKQYSALALAMVDLYRLVLLGSSVNHPANYPLLSCLLRCTLSQDNRVVHWPTFE